jgi:hypothetical protein
MKSNVINKSISFRVREHVPFARMIYQDILDEWLLETITVKRAKFDLKEKTTKLQNPNPVQRYSIHLKELVKRTHQTFGTHLFAFPSIGLYLFPQTENPFDVLFKSTRSLFQSAFLMKTLKNNSQILSRMTNLFYEHGLILSAIACPTGELRVEVRFK